MGERTFVNQARPLNSNSVRRSLRLRLDVPLLLIVITLLVFGLMMVLSASTDFSFTILGESPYYMFFHQAMYIGLGLAVAMVLSFIDYHFYRYLVVPMLVVAGAVLLI